MRVLSIVASAVLLTSILPAQLIPCGFTRIDPTCGPVFTGSDRILATPAAMYHAFRLQVSRAPANAQGVFAFSLKQTKIPFPGTRCFLLIDPTAMVTLPFSTNSKGTAQLRFTIKGKIAGTVFAQCGVDNRGSILTSNGQRITCR